MIIDHVQLTIILSRLNHAKFELLLSAEEEDEIVDLLKNDERIYGNIVLDDIFQEAGKSC